jgi:uncharacterized coiled-coil DUF342 family protein
VTKEENEIVTQIVRDLSGELREFAQTIQKIQTQQESIRRDLEQIKELRDKLARAEQKISDLETRNERVPPKLERLPSAGEIDTMFDSIEEEYVSKSDVKWFVFGVSLMFTAIQFALNYFLM